MVTMLTRPPLGSTAPAADAVRGVRDGGELELKDDAWRIEGLASTYQVDAMGDEIQPGAFLESLAKNPRPPLLWAHDTARVIGVAESLRETPDGLWGRFRLSRTRDAADVRQLCLDKAVDGLSIGFRVGPADMEFRGGLRRLKKIALYEVSVVALPAAPGARISLVKSLPAGAAPSYLAAFLERHARRTELESQRRQLQLLRLRLPVLAAGRWTGGG